MVLGTHPNRSSFLLMDKKYANITPEYPYRLVTHPKGQLTVPDDLPLQCAPDSYWPHPKG